MKLPEFLREVRGIVFLRISWCFKVFAWISLLSVSLSYVLCLFRCMNDLL